jgi:diaminopimelate decarboxylase/aspartate kinase
MSQTGGDVVVMKFGGTSVSTRQRWETIAEIARRVLAEGKRPVVVCSALSGISNLLEKLLAEAVRGAHQPIIDEIVAKHVKLGESMGIEVRGLLADELGLIERLALGTSLTREVSPRLQAAVMATGELMSTRMGAAFMTQVLGLETAWLDARELLEAIREENSNEHRHFLSSPCGFEPDEALRARLLAMGQPVLLTQGFIARDDAGETVLLGRGGSDTSAAYMAAKLKASRLEIWTDVPGMFTANPRQVPSARLLRQLDYQEAQELATMGAKVLHPRCIEPARRYNIPLHIRCTTHPQMEGTIISVQAPKTGPQVKAVSTKGKIPLVVLDTVGMWQQVGFLADVFGTFKRAGLSIDLITTSETNVTLTLDPVANALDAGTLQALVRDLGQYCQARTLGPCASVSLVGHNIRAILHQLGPVLEVFEEQQVYLMSQAASDLNLTFVVDEDQADRLVRELHALLFGGHAPDALIGPSWNELFEQPAGEQPAHIPVWWSARKAELESIAAQGPAYVYDAATLNLALDELKALTAIDQLFYAIKANPYDEILRLFEARGMSFECVSPGELDHVRGLFPALPVERMLFTPNFAPIDEYAYALEMGVTVTLDNLHPLKVHPEVFRGAALFARLDPGVGRGHHKHVRTAGPESKFGLSPSELPELLALAQRAGARIVGLHAHVGSGIRDAGTWAENALFLAGLAAQCPDVRTLNLGGGLGVVERPGDAALQIAEVAASLVRFKEAHPRFKLWLEPGRFCVAGAGALIARVTQLKTKGARAYVGVETGMNSLIRPSLYGAYHEIVNLTRLDQPLAMTADIVGPICETGDVLGYGRRLPETREGDVLLIGTAGAYGHAMASRYNLRAPAREVMLR